MKKLRHRKPINFGVYWNIYLENCQEKVTRELYNPNTHTSAGMQENCRFYSIFLQQLRLYLQFFYLS